VLLHSTSITPLTSYRVPDLAKCKSPGRLVGLCGGLDWQAECAIQNSHATAVVNMVV